MEMELCSNEMEHKFCRKMNAISEFLKKFKSDSFEGPEGAMVITSALVPLHWAYGNSFLCSPLGGDKHHTPHKPPLNRNPKLTQTNYHAHDPRFLSSNLYFYVYTLLFITKK